jgi:hypothetical protein
LILFSIYLATARITTNPHSPSFLEINVLDTNIKVSTLIDLCTRIGTKSIYTQDGSDYSAYGLTMNLSLLLDNSDLFANLSQYVIPFFQSPCLGKVNLERQTELLQQLKNTLLFGRFHDECANTAFNI